jgi:Tol biopolymer transport system component
VFPAWSGGSRTLFKAPSDGSAPAVELFPPVSAALYLLDIVGSHALVSVVSGSTFELRAVPLAGGSSTLLNPPPFDGSSAGFAGHPGGADVLFLSEGGILGMMRLFTVPIDGSAAPRLLSGPLVAGGDVIDFGIGAGGADIVYRADATNNESFELFGVPHAGGAAVRLSPPLPPGPVVGDVEEFRVTSDGERVFYLADQEQDEAVGLFLTRPDGRGSPRRLDAGLPETNDVFPGFATSADGRHVAYLRADSPGSANGDLYAVDLAAGGTPRMLDTDSARYQQELVLDPQAAHVFYLRLRVLFGGYDLVGARLDGSLTPYVLNTPTGTVTEFRLTPDGTTAIYRANTASGGAFELYRVPSDGSAAPAKLSATPVAGGNVTAFELSPDGARVVYLSDHDVDDVFELWSAPADASAPALELNAPLVAGGDVTHFRVTPDSAHVVYRADHADDQTFELLRVPIGGGASVVLTPLPADRAVQPDFVLAPDSQTVYFRANQAGQLRNELFRVPADGSAAPVALSGTLVTGGSVDGFELSHDGATLVFLADARIDNVKELWSVPATGGAPVLLQTLPATGDVTHFRIAADDSTVAWRADALQDVVYELFTAPLDGSAPARRQNAPLPTGGDVEDDFVPLADGRILFRADQEADGVLELFAAFQGTRGALQAPTPTRTVLR